MTMALFKLRTTHIPNVFPTLQQVQQEQSKAERDLCCKSPKAAAWLAVRITRLVPLARLMSVPSWPHRPYPLSAKDSPVMRTSIAIERQG